MGRIFSTLAMPGPRGDTIVQSLLFRAGLTSLLWTEAIALILWTVPSTFVIKRAYLMWIAKSSAVRFVSRLIRPSIAVLFWAWAREACAAVHAARETETERHMATVRRLRSGFALVLLLFMQRAYEMTRGNVNLIVAMDEAIVDKEVLNFKPPSLSNLELVTSAYKSVLDPVFFGFDNIPDQRPLLFVSNHTLLGFEFPLLLTELYKRKGIFLRALADHSHFQVPINGALLRNVMGAVDGNQHTADLLMKAGEAVFVYPGGARETFKRTTDKKYQLFWKEHLGFAKLAIRHGCTIVPVVNVGTEDMAEVVYDLPLGWVPIPFLYGSDRTLPIVKPPSLRRLQRVYFAFGEPIDTSAYGGDTCKSNLLEVRDAAQTQVLAGIHFLDQLRQEDSHRFASERIPAVKSLAGWIKAKAGEQSKLGASKM